MGSSEFRPYPIMIGHVGPNVLYIQSGYPFEFGLFTSQVAVRHVVP